MKMNINIWTEKKEDNGYERQKQRDHGYIFDVHSKSNHKIKKNVKHWNRAAFTIYLYWHFLEVFANHRNNIWQNRCMISMNFKWGRKKRWKRAKRKEEGKKALADTFWTFSNESTEKFFGNNKSNNWIMIQKINWTRGFARRKSIVLVFFYLLLRTNSHFKLNICSYIHFIRELSFFSTLFSMGEMHKTTTLSSTTSIFVCISFPSPSCYLLIKTEKKTTIFQQQQPKNCACFRQQNHIGFLWTLVKSVKHNFYLNSIRQMSKMQCLFRNWL